MKLRPVVAADHAALLRMNNAAVPAVNELTETEFAELVALCELAIVAEEDAEPTGFLLALAPGTAYDSENYRWFCDNEAGFCYLDRIVVDQGRRSGGIGAQLHDELTEHAAKRGFGTIALEVNLRPPNPRSIAFHQRLGFTEVHQLHTRSGKIVSMMRRALNTS
jgi:hypothetical protein